MPVLDSKEKELIVKSLAKCDSPGEVQKKFRAEKGVELSIQQISYYDADHSPKLAKKWRYMFQSTRRRYIEEVSVVPIANKAYRMNEMQRNYDKAKKAGNIVLAQQILEQAAKEVGGAFESKELLTPPGSSGGNFFQQINQTIINQQNNKNGTG